MHCVYTEWPARISGIYRQVDDARLPRRAQGGELHFAQAAAAAVPLSALASFSLFFFFFFFFFSAADYLSARPPGRSRGLSSSSSSPPPPTYNISNGLSGFLESRERSGTELPDSESDPDADRRTRRAGNRCSVGSCSRTAEPLMTQLPLSPCPVSPQSARQSAQ